MQEEVENRTVNLAISTTKLTGALSLPVSASICSTGKSEDEKGTRPCRSWKAIRETALGQNQGATNVEIDKESIRDFEKLAKKYGVDFAVRKISPLILPGFLFLSVLKMQMLWMQSARNIRQGH